MPTPKTGQDMDSTRKSTAGSGGGASAVVASAAGMNLLQVVANSSSRPNKRVRPDGDIFSLGEDPCTEISPHSNGKDFEFRQNTSNQSISSGWVESSKQLHLLQRDHGRDEGEDVNRTIISSVHHHHHPHHNKSSNRQLHKHCRHTFWITSEDEDEEEGGG